MPVHQTQSNKKNEQSPAFILKPLTGYNLGWQFSGALSQNVVIGCLLSLIKLALENPSFLAPPLLVLADLRSTAVSEDHPPFLSLALVPSL